jgi:prepilin-type N-terminal cleavage/methylation domain-containing protein/uncharacterized repeat protein (TIGR01451 family)
MKNSGFTLIELLIAVTIGLLVVGFGNLALTDFYEKQKVQGTTKEILSNLRLARNYALTSQLPQGADRVLVTIDTDGLFVIKAQNFSNNDIGDVIFSQDLTPKGVTVISNSIRFSIADGRLIGSAPVNIGVSGAEIRNIKIDESGLIYEQ